MKIRIQFFGHAFLCEEEFTPENAQTLFEGLERQGFLCWKIETETTTEVVTGPKTDDQLIDEAAERMRLEGVDVGDVGNAMRIVRETFGVGRHTPSNVAVRLLDRFEEFANR